MELLQQGTEMQIATGERVKHTQGDEQAQTPATLTALAIKSTLLLAIKKITVFSQSGVTSDAPSLGLDNTSTNGLLSARHGSQIR